MGQRIRQHLTNQRPCPTCHARTGRSCFVPTMRRRRDPSTGKPATVTVKWLHHARKAA